MTNGLAVTRALRAAADHIEERGWARCHLFTLDDELTSPSRLDEAPSCALGAIGWAAGRYVVDDLGRIQIQQSFSLNEVVDKTLLACDEYLRLTRPEAKGRGVIGWNDEVATSGDEVVQLLREVADWVDAGSRTLT